MASWAGNSRDQPLPTGPWTKATDSTVRDQKWVPSELLQSFWGAALQPFQRESKTDPFIVSQDIKFKIVLRRHVTMPQCYIKTLLRTYIIQAGCDRYLASKAGED